MQATIDNAPLAWDEAGQGPLLLLLHGYPFQRGLWAPQLPILSRRFRVVAVDLPGFGDSPAREDVSIVDDMARVLLALLEHLGASKAIVAGHSMGGYIALALARLYPQHLAGLILVASRAQADPPEAALNRRTIASRLLHTGETAEIVEAMSKKSLARDSANDRMRLAARALMTPLHPVGLARAQLMMALRPDSSHLLPTLQLPALVIAGAEDQIVPLEESGIMAAALPQGKLAVIEEAGHLPSWEKPAAFHEALLNWSAKYLGN